MFSKRVKLLVIGLLFVLGMILLQTGVNAANENIQILQNSSSEYLIYIKGNESSAFKFGFSNDSATEPTLNKESQNDSESGKTIAYVDNTTIALFGSKTYMWAKLNDGEYILEGVEVDLSKAAKATDLDQAASITKIIEADLSKTSTTEKIENGVKITTTVGEIVLKDENGDYSYIIIPLPNSDDYNNLMKIATKVSKFNSETDMFTQIEAYSEFINLFNSLKPNAEAGWIDAKSWKEDIGTEFPVVVDACFVSTIKTAVSEYPYEINQLCTTESRIIDAEEITVGLLSETESNLYTQLSFESHVLNPEVSGKIRIHAFDKKYQYTFRVE